MGNEVPPSGWFSHMFWPEMAGNKKKHFFVIILDVFCQKKALFKKQHPKMHPKMLFFGQILHQILQKTAFLSFSELLPHIPV